MMRRLIAWLYRFRCPHLSWKSVRLGALGPINEPTLEYCGQCGKSRLGEVANG